MSENEMTRFPRKDELSARLTTAAAALGLETAPFQKLFDERIGLDSVTDLDNDDLFKFGDFLKKFEDYPIGKVRKAFAALKGGRAAEKVQHTGTGTGGDARINELKDMGFKVTPKDADTSLLLAHYYPDKPNDPVTRALKERFGDQPIIAFDDDGKVSINATMEYVSGVEQGFPKSETISVNGRLVKLWPVGVVPDVMVEEDPLFPGSPLRNGVSVVNHRNWSKVTQSNRQFCRLVVERGALDPDNHDAVLRLLERAQEDSVAKLRDVYPEVDLIFREKAKRDELPKLKIELGKMTKPQNPFGVKRSY